VGRRCFKTTYIGVTTAIQKPPIKPIQWVKSKEPAKKLNEDLSTIIRAERHIVKRIMTNAPHRSGALKRSISLTSLLLVHYAYGYILTE
jgi:hypothetical protein